MQQKENKSPCIECKEENCRSAMYCDKYELWFWTMYSKLPNKSCHLTQPEISL